ncbi:hypothetical protein O181_049918 [Austropuccinia psidii MF-1]|uniref:Uncharacterized protein n=1 Tax=Austropuccinia psidii MF-1 TaxID=1389203 RepID=A0A9Q3HLW6_9BASI|nr:hypothetical protein [Austropuccinia psidii MF-1]
MSQPITPPTNASNPNLSEESIQQNDIKNLKVDRAIPEANTGLYQATVETQSLPQTLVLHATIPAQISPRRHPIQMSANDFPPSFQGVKVLWKLVEINSVPDPFPPSVLSNCYCHFSNTDEIKNVAEDSTAPSFIDEDDVADFVVEKAASLSLGRDIGNLSESLVLYIRGTLAHLGITIWSPNLAQSRDGLYSSACRIGAITTLKQVASAGAYDYMAMNHIYILDSALLQHTYDHYVHFVVKSRFDQEQRMAGAMKQQAQKKAVNKNCACLCDAQIDFAILTKLPMRYRRIIQELGAHCEDESV